jgi:hypothetical protein
MTQDALKPEGYPSLPSRAEDQPSVDGERHQCLGITPEGEPCQAPSKFVAASGFCMRHDPAPDVRAFARSASIQGGLRTAQRFKRTKRLEPGALGALNTPEDCQRWCRIAAEAVAEGRLSNGQGSTIRALVAEWLKGRDLMVRESRLASLERRVEDLQPSGNGKGRRPAQPRHFGGSS